jgi:hypothetical protein
MAQLETFLAGNVEALRRVQPGSAWSSARQADWLAFAHPHAGVVRLRRDDGRTVHVSCPSPFNVAWAGDSLVVTSGPGEPGVFLFRELASKLEALGGI